MKKFQRVKKTKGFRFYGLSLLVMVLATSLVMIPAFAMTTTTIITGVQVAASSDWTVSTSAGTVSVTKSGKTTSSGCSSSDSTADSATLTITNTSGEDARLSFDYTYSAGTLYIAGTGYTVGGSYSADIAAGGTVSVYLTSPSGSSSSGTSVLSNFVLTSLSATANVTFGDSITAKIDGVSVDATGSYDIEMSSVVTATASAAADGMQFAWWAVDGDYYSDSTTLTWSPASDDAFVITAVYIPDGAAVFTVGTSLYYDLGDAISAAGSSGTITVSISGTLYSGEGASGYDASTGETNYTIPSGITLIVPRQAGDDGSLTWASSTMTAQSVYRELIVAEDTTITVKGTVILSGKQGHSNPRSGSVIGPYGLVTLYGEIIVANGGQMDAFGYIKGDGLVTAEDGSNVREILEITDFCGGTKTSNIYSYMFPVSQYFIQNIQTDYRIETGAKLEAHYYVYMTLTTADYITYIDDSTDAMFQLTDGYVIRHYDEDDPDYDVAYADRLTMELHGTMYSASLAITFMSKSVDSKNYELPVPENMTLQITEGSTFYMQNAYKLLPGTKVKIDEGGNLDIISGGELYIYNTTDYDYHYGSNYTAYNLAKSISGWGDAEIINNGTMTINGGVFYESPSGGIIEGTGVIVYANDKSSSSGAKIYEYAYSSGTLIQEEFNKVTLDGIDGDIATATGTTYQGTEDGFWYNTNGTVSIVENTTTTVDDNQIAVDVVLTPDCSVTDGDFAVSVSYGSTDLELVSGNTSISVTGEDFAAGEAYVLETLVFNILDTCGGEAAIEFVGDGTWTLGDYEFMTFSTTNYTYYPTYTITYSDGTDSVSYTAGDDDITLPVLDDDADGNEFLGWSCGGVVYTEIDTDSAQNYDLTAVWDVTNTYTITYSESVGDDAVTSYTNKDTETITLPTLEKDDYTFDGWYETDDETQEIITTINPATAKDYDLTAKWTAVTYTISFSDDVTDMTYTVEDGTITLPTPEKDGYGFAGWYVAEDEDTVFTTLDATTASDLTLTAKWSLNIITYTISFSDDVEAVTYTNETTETITLPTLEDTEEDTFDGWYVTDDETQTIITTIDPATAKDYSLTAKWTEMEITVDPGAGGGGTTDGPTLPGGDDEQTTTDVTEPGEAPSTGDTIEVTITPDDDTDEPAETVALTVTIVTNEDVVVDDDNEDEPESTGGYNALPEDTNMIVLSVVTADTDDETDTDTDTEPATPVETETTDDAGNSYVEGYCYDGQPMFWSELYGGYVYIYDETEGFDASLVTAGEAIVLEYDGDIYGDGEVSAFDVSRIYRLAMGDWSDSYEVVDMQARLEADVNGDGVVDIDDALYVLKQLWD